MATFNKLKTVFLLSLFWVPLSSEAQTNTTTNINGWFMYFGNHHITEKLGIHTEYQWRRHDVITNWQQSLLRVGLDWYANKTISLTAGYGWIRSYAYGEQPIKFDFNEHRIWQQLIINQQSGRLYFQHRYRLEQRFLENLVADNQGEAQQDGYKYRNRARYRFFLAIPLTREKMQDNTWFAGFYDEVFLGFGRGIGKNILDQNRIYFSIGWRKNKNCNIQLGYLNHYVIKSDGILRERNHTLQLGLQYNLDLRKKEG